MAEVTAKTIIELAPNLAGSQTRLVHIKGTTAATGDTLTEGNAKIDTIKADLNASLKAIDPTYFTGAPLSSELPSTPVPKAGDVREY